MFKVIAVAFAVATITGAAGAQATGTYKSTAKPAMKTTNAKRHRTMSQAALRKQAKISEETARATALKEVPNGTIKSSELEREKGKLIYSFDIAVPGKSGVEEVNVSAIDGSVVAREHETPKMEKAEAAKEKAKK